MIAMCLKWLSTYAPPQARFLEIIFSVPGHSFIPPDRVIARIEKVIKKKDTIVIVNPGYHLGSSVKVYNWKEAFAKALKPTVQWHIQFNTCKRFSLKCGKNGQVTLGDEQS